MSQDRHNTLTRRIERFFAENPGEWLTMDDICAKFTASPDQVKTAIQRVRRHGRVNPQPVIVYRAEAPQ